MTRMAPRVAALAVVGVVVGAALLSCASAGTRAPQPPSAVFVSPTGLDTNPGTAALPVLTFERAYQLARPGEAVELAAGSYAYQQIVLDPTKTDSQHVIFRPAPGAAVSVSRIDLGQGQYGVSGPAHITLQGFDVGNLAAWDGTEDVTLLNLTGRSFDILSYNGTRFGPADHVTVLGGSFGPCQAPRDGDCTVRLIGTNITVDGTSIHDAISTDLVNHHVDGMFVRGCTHCIVRRTKFWGNMITNIRIQNCCDLPPNSDVTLENDLFGAPIDANGNPRADAVNVDTPTPGLVVRNNSFAENAGLLLVPTDLTGTNTQVVGNLMANLPGPCPAGVTYSHNVTIPFSSSTGTRACGATDRVVQSFRYANPATLDFHLLPRSPAIAHGDPANCARVDIDGKARPKDVPCDAGADQRRDTAACLTTHPRGKLKQTTIWVSGTYLAGAHPPTVRAGRCKGG